MVETLYPWFQSIKTRFLVSTSSHGIAFCLGQAKEVCRLLLILCAFCMMTDISDSKYSRNPQWVWLRGIACTRERVGASTREVNGEWLWVLACSKVSTRELGPALAWHSRVFYFALAWVSLLCMYHTCYPGVMHVSHMLVCKLAAVRHCRFLQAVWWWLELVCNSKR